jgi:hypothetical protein
MRSLPVPILFEAVLFSVLIEMIKIRKTGIAHQKFLIINLPCLNIFFPEPEQVTFGIHAVG